MGAGIITVMVNWNQQQRGLLLERGGERSERAGFREKRRKKIFALYLGVWAKPGFHFATVDLVLRIL